MQKFVWTDSLSTGVAMIDIQHRELIAAINDLAEAIEQGKGVSAVKKLLTFLKYYAEWHFDNEEKCVMRHKCPIGSTNEQAHKKFLQIVAQRQEEYRQTGGNEEMVLQIHQELADWLVSHIMKIDTQIGECIRASNLP